MSKWYNLPGTFVFEFSINSNGDWISETRTSDLNKVEHVALTDNLKAIVLKYFGEVGRGDWFEVDIYFNSSGYDEDASMYGGKDHMGYAAEGEDERIVYNVEIIRGDAVAGGIDKKVSIKNKKDRELLADDYCDEIYATELDKIEDDEPEYSPEDEYDREEDEEY